MAKEKEEVYTKLVYELSLYNERNPEDKPITVCNSCKTIFNFMDTNYNSCPFCGSMEMISS